VAGHSSPGTGANTLKRASAATRAAADTGDNDEDDDGDDAGADCDEDDIVACVSGHPECSTLSTRASNLASNIASAGNALREPATAAAAGGDSAAPVCQCNYSGVQMQQ
jgi:hypothetical protein